MMKEQSAYGALRCCVFGAGGVGGHMAVRLASAGLAVSVVARGEHLQAIKARGIRLLLEEGQSLHAQVRATANPADLGPQDVVIIAVKLASLGEVLEAAQPLIHRGTRVIFAMNGLPWWFPKGLAITPSLQLQRLLDPSEQLSNQLAVDQWVACVVTSGNRVVSPGVIQSESPGMDALVLGFEDGRKSDAIMDTFVDHARAGGYRASFTDGIRAAIWRKLLINAAISAVSAVANCSIRDVCEHPATYELTTGIMHEIIGVGRKLGIELDVVPEDIAQGARTANHVTSFLQDRRAGRVLEISNGILAVQELARITNVAAPRLDTIARLMQFFSDGAAGQSRKTVQAAQTSVTGSAC